MKRVGDLFSTIADLGNLRLAFAKACRGKRDHGVVRKFSDAVNANLAKMRENLLAGRQAVGRFHQFVVHDPKKRIITAPCFEERVLHHAIMNVCEPIFERRLIDDTFACRTGLGRIAALHRARKFASRSKAYLKLDIRKYFDSIPHAQLQDQLARVFKDVELLKLFASIINAFRGNVQIGLPIGSLTSQHLANLYLDPLDRFVKETLRMRGYVRYMDDMLIWGDSPSELVVVERHCCEFAQSHLGLEIKRPTAINYTQLGVSFLGCRLFPDHLRLNRRSKLRLGRKLRQLESQFSNNLISELELQRNATALLAFTTAGGVKSWQVRRNLLERLPVSGHKARTG